MRVRFFNIEKFDNGGIIEIDMEDVPTIGDIVEIFEKYYRVEKRLFRDLDSGTTRIVYVDVSPIFLIDNEISFSQALLHN